MVYPEWSPEKQSHLKLNHLITSNCLHRSQKLRLFSSQSGGVFQVEATLDELTQDSDVPLISGSTVILEYVHDNCDKLDDLTEYQN